MIVECLKKSYFTYFGIKSGDQDKSWVPHLGSLIRAKDILDNDERRMISQLEYREYGGSLKIGR